MNNMNEESTSGPDARPSRNSPRSKRLRAVGRQLQPSKHLADSAFLRAYPALPASAGQQ
jgi:hypothetical protein